MSATEGHSGGLAEAYARFRGGRAFLYTLATVVFSWLAWNLIPGLPHFDDPGFGRLNLFLSTEASLSVALLIMANERQAAAERRQAKYMLDVIEAVRDMLVELKEARSCGSGSGVSSSSPPSSDSRCS